MSRASLRAPWLVLGTNPSGPQLKLKQSFVEIGREEEFVGPVSVCFTFLITHVSVPAYAHLG